MRELDLSILHSTYEMFGSVIENKKAVVLFSATDLGKKHSFVHGDWKLAEYVVELLKPAYKATNDISGAYVTGSMVIPLTKVLFNTYAGKFTSYPDVTEDNFPARYEIRITI